MIFQFPVLFTVKDGLNVIHNAERRMIGPAQVVGRSLIDHESAGRFRQFRCCELIVDPPANIVVECTTALAPPCVRSLDISGRDHASHPQTPVLPAICRHMRALRGEIRHAFSLALAFLMSSGVCAMLKSPQSTACFPPCAASSRNCSMRASMVSRKRYFCFIFSGSSVFPACTYTQVRR